MQVEFYDVPQGSDDWHKVRGYGASELPAAMGVSPYVTTNDLVERYQIGAPEPTQQQKILFERGHILEGLLMPEVERHADDDFSAMVCGAKIDGLSLPVTGSFDGLTFSRKLGAECKTLNKAIKEAFANGAGNDARLLPIYYRVQMCQLIWLGDLDEMIFAAGELLGSEYDGWSLGETLMTRYKPEPEIIKDILPTWHKIEAARKVWVPKSAVLEVAEKELKLAPIPVQATGMVKVVHGLEKYGRELKGFEDNCLKAIKSDADIAAARKNKRELEAGHGHIEMARRQIIGAIPEIQAALALADELDAKTKALRLGHEKMIDGAASAIKAEILNEGRAKIAQRIAEIRASVGFAPPSSIRLELVIKGLSSFDSMRGKVATAVVDHLQELSDAEALALANIEAIPDGARHLMPDLEALVWRDRQSFDGIVSKRVAEAAAAAERRAREIAAEAERVQRTKQEQEEAAKSPAEPPPVPQPARGDEWIAVSAEPSNPTPQPPSREYPLGSVCMAIGAAADVPDGVKISSKMLEALGATWRRELAAKLFAAPSLARALHCLASEIAHIASKIEAGEDI